MWSGVCNRAAAVRVLKIQYAPGSKSTMHQHPDSIVVPLAASKVRFHLPDGKSEEMNLPSESAISTPAGTHTPENIGTTAVDAVLIEFKSAKPGNAVLPSSRENLTLKPLAEGPHAVAHRITAAPGSHERAGSKHDYDQVVIALGALPMSLALDGKPAKTTWARGDVQFIGRGVPHEARNTGDKPADFVIVSIR
jgi:quercetin dioxygenase-like cupin family protein